MDISDLVREMTKLVKPSVPKTVTWPIILGLKCPGAIRQQLGLSLKFRREPVGILVIDHAEKHRRTRDAARCSYPSSDQSHHFSATAKTSTCLSKRCGVRQDHLARGDARIPCTSAITQ